MNLRFFVPIALAISLIVSCSCGAGDREVDGYILFQRKMNPHIALVEAAAHVKAKTGHWPRDREELASSFSRVGFRVYGDKGISVTWMDEGDYDIRLVDIPSNDEARYETTYKGSKEITVGDEQWRASDRPTLEFVMRDGAR